MIMLIISIMFYLGFLGLGGLSYYYLIKTPQELILSIVFIGSAILCLIIAIIFSYIFSSRKYKKKINVQEEQLKKWSNISYHATRAGDDAFNKLPIGIIVYDENYMVMWSNEFASKIFNSVSINDQALEVLSKTLLEKLTLSETEFVISLNESSYDVIHNVENNVIYFFDVTAREEIKKRYNNRITGLGVIEIDNLEESLKKFDMQEQANIRGEILGEVSDWISKYNCYLRSVSQDRMLFMMDKESLNKMIENNFSVLSDVRDISQKNKLKATLSIGIACHDVEYDELGSIAQAAIELAEKRGGDQAVVNIQNEKIKFFGGNTNSLEKNTLVEVRMQTLNLKEAVEQSSDVLIMCHNRADTDAIGSMIGVYHMVITSNKDVKMVFDINRADTTVKKVYGEILKDASLKSQFIGLDAALDMIKPSTLLIVTDTQSPKIVMFPELLTKAKRLSIIDHHRAGDVGWEKYLSYYVESSASSSVELVSEMFMFYNSNITVKPLEASIMLSGIIVDTNNFTFRSGTRTFEAAATLKSMGADMIYVKKLLQEPLDTEQFISKALTNAKIEFNKFSFIVFDEEEIIPDSTILAKISDRQLTIAGVLGSFTIGRLNETTVGISARSLGNNINVQVIMEEMGGGGHFNSAATQIKNQSIERVYNRLIELLGTGFGEEGVGNMKVILTQDVKGKGKKGTIIDVANGYANYLISAKQAVQANEENLEEFNRQKALEAKEAESKKKALKKLRDEIDGKAISIELKVGKDGKNFGNITTKLVCEQFQAQTGITLDKRKVELPGDIASIGIYTASVKLDTDIIAQFEIKVEEKK